MLIEYRQRAHQSWHVAAIYDWGFPRSGTHLEVAHPLGSQNCLCLWE